MILLDYLYTYVIVLCGFTMGQYSHRPSRVSTIMFAKWNMTIVLKNTTDNGLWQWSGQWSRQWSMTMVWTMLSTMVHDNGLKCDTIVICKPLSIENTRPLLEHCRGHCRQCFSDHCREHYQEHCQEQVNKANVKIASWGLWNGYGGRTHYRCHA